ncbi:MAG: acetyl-CoA hydrolase/transferase C-terminal domain-containing protein [Candidatus Competibacteraceae bacterium]|jgi:acyl-CoA hydrolase|nr:acetyl-CoA hydrolase/transferase C-terminal domain-containing protein [Candidatus Competibacteraceae bacterium]
MPVYYNDVNQCADDIIAKIGNNIVLATPLALGKPNQLVNALFRKAKENTAIHLKILTALTLEKPKGSSDLEKRFLEPFVERVFGDYPELEYALALRSGELPANIEIEEFFFKPGSYIKVAHAQHHYASINYTHVARELVEKGVNVMAQMISKKTIAGQTYYSLSGNPDVTVDLLSLLMQRNAQDRPFMMVGQINNNLPFMYHDAMLEADVFNAIVENSEYDFKLFGPPNMPVDTADYLLGIYASTLIKDGGTIQIGIGSLGDAITYACKIRHENNQLYNTLLADLAITEKYSDLIKRIGGTNTFDEGLYGSSEMFVNGFWHLYKTGILKRRVFDHIGLQKLLNQGKIKPVVTAATLDDLLDAGVIQPKLTRGDFEFLQHFGILKQGLQYQPDYIETEDKREFSTDLTGAENRAELAKHCLGAQLDNGIVLHAGFFLGPQSLYEALRNLDESESKAFFMTGVSHVNQLYGHEELAILQRKDARFINTTMMMTLLGAAVSDGLEDGQVISGVGGQYNFVAMAHALRGARSILMLKSTRDKGGNVSSNIVWNYGHTTIPRHLRDIVITEYGIADLRGQSDQGIIAALLNIADSRFQEDLLEKAKHAGKIAQDYQIPDTFRNNTPERLETALASYKVQGLFMDFPFGTDFTPEELVLVQVLKSLKAQLSSMGGLLKSIFQTIEVRKTPPAAQPYLARLGLAEPESWKDEVIQRMILAELISSGHVADE